jgi:hypothetical protein
MVAIAVGVGLSASSLVAEQDAPRKLIAPVRGEAVVEITSPQTNPVKDEVISTMLVKNVSTGPIAGFKIEENWYKGNDPVGGDTYRHPRPLPVGEVIRVTLKTPRAAIVGARNQFQFSHANGTIKPKAVKQLDEPKPVAGAKPDPAAKPAAGAKPPAKPPVD